MRPSEEEVLRSLVAQWVAKADLDFDVAARLASEPTRFRESIGFHAQQAAEKYLKALLVRHGVQFPKTHDIEQLLDLLANVHPRTAEALRKAEVLTPFGVEIRYPGDFPEMLPGEEKTAVELAGRVKEAVIALLAAFLSGG